MIFKIDVTQIGQLVFSVRLEEMPRQNIEELLILFRRKFPRREKFKVAVTMIDEAREKYDSIEEYFLSYRRTEAMRQMTGTE